VAVAPNQTGAQSDTCAHTHMSRSTKDMEKRAICWWLQQSVCLLAAVCVLIHIQTQLSHLLSQQHVDIGVAPYFEQPTDLGGTLSLLQCSPATAVHSEATAKAQFPCDVFQHASAAPDQRGSAQLHSTACNALMSRGDVNGYQRSRQAQNMSQGKQTCHAMALHSQTCMHTARQSLTAVQRW
jgi:hypothetical protein